MARTGSSRAARLLMLGVAVVGSNSLALGPILNDVARDLATTPAAVGQANAAYGAATALSALTLGRLVDRMGAGTVLVRGLLVLALAMLSSAAATHWAVLAGAQALAGAAASAILPATYALATTTAEPEREAEGMPCGPASRRCSGTTVAARWKWAFAPRGGTVIELDMAALSPVRVCGELLGSGATALLLLVGFPEPAVSIVKAVRHDRRLAGMLIGAPAGQSEFAGWMSLLGEDGAANPFLRYLPDRLGPMGARVEAALRERLGEPPSFIAFEACGTITVLAEVLRSCGLDRAGSADSWPSVAVEGTRGQIRFSRMSGIGVWQRAWPPIQVVDRDPAEPDRFRVLRAG